jgi:hypothetical protein
VQAQFYFKPLVHPTDHIEHLILDNIYEEDKNGEDCVPPVLTCCPSVSEMELPGLKKIEVVGGDLPQAYIFTFFDAICNPKLPSCSLRVTECEAIDLLDLVICPIFRNLHTINIATGEPADLSKDCLTSHPSNFA